MKIWKIVKNAFYRCLEVICGLWKPCNAYYPQSPVLAGAFQDTERERMSWFRLTLLYGMISSNTPCECEMLFVIRTSICYSLQWVCVDTCAFREDREECFLLWMLFTCWQGPHTSSTNAFQVLCCSETFARCPLNVKQWYCVINIVWSWWYWVMCYMERPLCGCVELYKVEGWFLVWP